MPATSQKQEKFFNFVHAVQEGEASGKGYPKVEEASHEMKPGSVEHFMGRGHIDKSLPKKAEAFERGFMKAALQNGVDPLLAVTFLHQ
jgi:hypothetical protein